MILLHTITAVFYVITWRISAFFLPAVVLHLIGIISYQLPQPRFDIGILLSLFLLITALVAWRHIRFASRKILLTLAALSTFTPILLNPVPMPFLTPATVAHIFLAMLAYAFAATAMLQWLDLCHVERARRQLTSEETVPLLMMEKNCFRTIAYTFLLLSLTLVSGILFVKGGQPAHKILFAVLTWLTFGGLLAGRHYWGWRGRKAQIWLTTGFVFFVLSYFGTYFVLQVLLDKT